jgi:hypothetical protein
MIIRNETIFNLRTQIPMNFPPEMAHILLHVFVSQQIEMLEAKFAVYARLACRKVESHEERVFGKLFLHAENIPLEISFRLVVFVRMLTFQSD